MFADDLSDLKVLEILPKALRLSLPDPSFGEPGQDLPLNVPPSKNLIQRTLPIPLKNLLPAGDRFI
jgi:hypothetical protein